MKTRAKHILISSLILVVGFIMLYFLSYIIPSYLLSIPININGVLLIIYVTIILVYSLKFYKKKSKKVKIIELTLIGTISIFISEVIYQIFHHLIFNSSEFSIIRYFQSVITMTIGGLVTSFLISYQLKTGKTGRMILMILGIFIIFAITLTIFPSLFILK